MEVVAHEAESKHPQATELLVAPNELEELVLFVLTEDESAITDAADDMVSPAVGEGIRDKETGKAHDEGEYGASGRKRQQIFMIACVSPIRVCVSPINDVTNKCQ
jgi:hypothetical protein